MTEATAPRVAPQSPAKEVRRPATPEEVFRHAADLLEEFGWQQGSLGTKEAGAMCALGAVFAAERDLGGDDVPDNLVPLCVLCHQRVEERKRPAIESLRESLTAEEVAYIWAKKGYFYLVRYYPRRSAEDVQPTASAEISV